MVWVFFLFLICCSGLWTPIYLFLSPLRLKISKQSVCLKLRQPRHNFSSFEDSLSPPPSPTQLISQTFAHSRPLCLSLISCVCFLILVLLPHLLLIFSFSLFFTPTQGLKGSAFMGYTLDWSCCRYLLFLCLCAGDSRDRRHYVFRSSVRPYERDISGTPGGSIFKSSTNFHLNSRINWLEFGGQMSRSTWP